MRTGTGKSTYGHMRDGNTQDTGLTLLPPPRRCVHAPPNNQWGGVSLEAPQDRHGQVYRMGGLQGETDSSGHHGGSGSSGGHGELGALEAMAGGLRGLIRGATKAGTI